MTVRVFAHKCREIIPLALSFIGFGIAVFSVWFFFFKPWPGVITSDNWTIVDEPENGYYRNGDLLTWSKPVVCIPAGETTTQIFFIRELPNGLGDVQQLAYTRVFHLNQQDCREPNYTTIVVPYDLQPGEHQIRLRACTNTPSPIDTCVEAEGPRILVHDSAGR